MCNSDRILNQADQYSKFMSTVVGLKSMTICDDKALLGNSIGKDLVSRTVDNCSVHLNVAGLIDRQMELKKNRDKLNKLVDSLARLEVNMSTSSYRMTAPVQVQESHRLKVASLRTEINQLKDYIIKILEL